MKSSLILFAGVPKAFVKLFVACFSWPYWNTTNINQGCSSWTAYLLPCVGNAIVNVGAAPATTLACSARVRNQDRPFGINLHGVANAEKVSFTNYDNLYSMMENNFSTFFINNFHKKEFNTDILSNIINKNTFIIVKSIRVNIQNWELFIKAIK